MSNPELALAPPADDRRARVREMLRRRRAFPTLSPEEAAERWGFDRFVARARALFYARLVFLSLGLLMIAVPEWQAYFGLSGPVALGGYFAMLLYSIANYLVIGHRVAGPWVTYITLCLDLLVLVVLIAKPRINGGLQSPFLATQLLYTTLFAILFPRPIAILPPLLALPVTTRLDLLLNRPVTAVDVLTLLWYSALNFIIVYVVVYLHQREAASHREVTQLQGDLQELAVVEERNRLAREIHDGLGGSLSSLIIQSEYVMQLTQDASVRKEIAELKNSAEESIEELRRSLRMMREDFELSSAIADHVKTFSERTQLSVSFEQEGLTRKLASDVQLTLFRVLQESLSNAAKHAEAKHVQVRLWYAPDAVHLTIQDDGRGFRPLQIPHGHYGLLNMRERAAKARGVVVVDSTPGQGTHVSLSLPFESD